MDDLETFWTLESRTPAEVCCVNRAGLWFPCYFRFWVSWHGDYLVEWGRQRPGPELWSAREQPGVRHAEVEHPYGSSSMNAVQLALDTWGFDKAVVLGVHLTGPYAGYQSAWPPLKGTHGTRIRAIGGYAEQLFGRPDAAFLGEA